MLKININYNIETLKMMKATDKAKAFDMIVEACNKENADQDVIDILSWCSEWFGKKWYFCYNYYDLTHFVESVYIIYK